MMDVMQLPKDEFSNERKATSLETDVLVDAVVIPTRVTTGMNFDVTNTGGCDMLYNRAVYHRNTSELLKKEYESSTVLRAPLVKMGFAKMQVSRWIPPRHINIYKALHSYHLDFSMAEFLYDTCTVHIYSAIGSLSIIVPPGVNVTSGTVNIIGRNRLKDNSTTNHLRADATTITVHITGLTFVGGVKVEVNKNALPLLAID